MLETLKTKLYDNKSNTVYLVTNRSKTGSFVFSNFEVISNDPGKPFNITEYGIKSGYYETLADVNHFLFNCDKIKNEKIINLLKDSSDLEYLKERIVEHCKKTQHKLKYIPFYYKKENDIYFQIDLIKKFKLDIKIILTKTQENIKVKVSTTFHCKDIHTIITISDGPINTVDSISNEVFKNINMGLSQIYISVKERKNLVNELLGFFNQGRVGFNNFIKNI